MGTCMWQRRDVRALTFKSEKTKPRSSNSSSLHVAESSNGPGQGWRFKWEEAHDPNNKIENHGGGERG